jgi:UDP-glucose 4-epimerase
LYGPARPGETFKIYLDASRASRELGWQPTIPLHEGLKLTVDYFKQAEIAHP